MPIDILTTADSVRVQGPLNIIPDPQGGLPNVNISGTLVVTGTASYASGVTISSASVGTIVGLTTISGPMTISGGYNYDVVTGGLPPATASSQSLSTGSSINMTSGVSVGGAHVIYVSANSSAATVALTPTSSANTSGVYQNGLEVTVINLAATGSTVVIPSVSAGASAPFAVTISGGQAKKFIYIAALQSWIPQF
jgi:hypothetical protein